MVTEHAKPSDAVADCDKVQQLLSEIEVLEPTLKTTLDPEEYISTVKISDNLNEVTNSPELMLKIQISMLSQWLTH